MKVFVTGGAGLIGSHVVRKLLSDGNNVVALDNLSTGQYEHIPDGVTFWQEDIRSAVVRERIVDGHFDAIVHLAAQILVSASIRDPYFDADENIMGLVNVLEGARAGGVRRVIFPSSAAVYGDVAESQLPLTGDTPLAPLSFYGLTKEMSERYLELYHRHYGLEYVVLRFANVCGERQGYKGEGDIYRSCLSRAKAQEGLGWEPCCSLKEGLRKTLDYFVHKNHKQQLLK